LPPDPHQEPPGPWTQEDNLKLPGSGAWRPLRGVGQSPTFYKEVVMNRRSFLKGALAAALFMGTAQAWPARADETGGNTLSMYNTHTDEYIMVTHRDERGDIIPAALEKINNFLRCHYTGEVHRIEPGLIDLLCKVDSRHGGGNLINVISGYRSPEYNAVLANRSTSVARSSLHMKGMAIDFQLPGVGMRELYDTVRSLKAGGAGIYSEFVHMDVGRVRHWGEAAV
jgi:uncharacterized protein YcbK (DUF882 family)